MNLRLVGEVDEARAYLELAFAPHVVDAIERLVDARVAAELDAREAATPKKPWLTLAEAGEQLGCSPNAVRMRARRGRLEERRHGRRIYVSAASVERLSGAA